MLLVLSWWLVCATVMVRGDDAASVVCRRSGSTYACDTPSEDYNQSGWTARGTMVMGTLNKTGRVLWTLKRARIPLGNSRRARPR